MHSAAAKPVFELLQKQRCLRFDAPSIGQYVDRLGTERLFPTQVSGRERISDLFEFTLDMIASDEAISPRDIVGKRVSFLVQRPDREGSARWFDGIVSRFVYTGTDDRLTRFRATVVPALWFATKTTDSRIFQEMTVPDIVSEILRETPGVVFDDSGLDARLYARRDYCVQHQETDFAFICRLLEEEGIYFYFIHDRGRHVMILGDSPSSYRECAEPTANQYESSSIADPFDQLIEWNHQFSFTSGRYASTDYNYLKPETSLIRDASAIVDLEVLEAIERFEYPGRFDSIPLADRRVRVRIEEEESHFDTASGASRCCTWHCGGRFRIGLHPARQERGAEYVLTSVTHEIHSGGYTTGTAITPFTYENRFECVPAKVAYRPPRKTPRPVMPGPQPAIVTGPKGQEIHTDPFGRVKVQFFWDRRGKYDDRSSCWLRSSQPWAGRKWGGIQIPRIGQEVIVDFLDGDPDQPIITGRVYNADSMPPVSGAGRDPKKGEANPKDMIEAAMQMSMRSNSLGGSGGHNEITLHDAGGKEKLFIRAQKDEVHLVQNDRKDTVGNNEEREVGVDRTRKVGNNETVEIGVNELRVVGASSTEQIGTAKTVIAGTTLQCGASTIHMNQAGIISINGTMINIVGSIMSTLTAPITMVTGAVLMSTAGAVNMSTGGLNWIEGATKMHVGGGEAELKADGTCVVSGGSQVKIN